MFLVNDYEPQVGEGQEYGAPGSYHDAWARVGQHVAPDVHALVVGKF